MKHFTPLVALAVLCALTACQSAAWHAADVHQAEDSAARITLGTVQREIHNGMTSTQVAEVLGAPNMVTSDGNHGETWVYDRIATESAYSGSTAGGSLILLGAGGAAAAHSTSQRSLTVIIKFDYSGRVRDYSYRASAF